MIRSTDRIVRRDDENFAWLFAFCLPGLSLFAWAYQGFAEQNLDCFSAPTLPYDRPPSPSSSLACPWHPISSAARMNRSPIAARRAGPRLSRRRPPHFYARTSRCRRRNFRRTPASWTTSCMLRQRSILLNLPSRWVAGSSGSCYPKRFCRPQLIRRIVY